MASAVKVLLLHFAGENRDAKAARLAQPGMELVVEEPRWPRFVEVIRREKPAAIVVDFSRAPYHALETLDYIGKSKMGRDLDLFAIHVFDEKRDELGERVPRAQALSERELAAALAERLPKWQAAAQKSAETAAAQTAGARRAGGRAPAPRATPRPEKAARRPAAGKAGRAAAARKPARRRPASAPRKKSAPRRRAAKPRRPRSGKKSPGSRRR